MKPTQQQQSWICSGQFPLKGKSALIIEDNALIAMNVEVCLLDAGAAMVKTANSIASAKSALDEGIPFDAAVVDLHLADGNATSLIQALSERGIAVVITTGDVADEGPVCSQQSNHRSSKAPYRQGPYQCPNEMRGGAALGTASDPIFNHLTIYLQIQQETRVRSAQ